MNSRFDGIMLRGLDRLIPVGQEDVLGLEVATVTSEKGERPITVHKLSDPAGVDIQILTYWIDPDPGQRVWLMKTKTQRIIVGVHGGPSIPNEYRATVASSAVDWNDLTDEGISKYLLTGNAPNGPGTGDYFYVWTVSYNGVNVTQWAIPYITNAGNTPSIWMRSRYGGVWAPWVRLSRDGDDVVSTAYGSLSGSGGTPAGGYIKHASGFLECWVRASITPVANSWTAQTWTFPVPFTVIPAITMVADTAAETVQNASYASPAVGSCQVGLVRSNTTSTGFSATARGWWK